MKSDTDTQAGNEPCELCGGEADPTAYDGHMVTTPDGPVSLNYNVPACDECRNDVIEILEQRGTEQKGLADYNSKSDGGDR